MRCAARGSAGIRMESYQIFRYDSNLPIVYHLGLLSTALVATLLYPKLPSKDLLTFDGYSIERRYYLYFLVYCISEAQSNAAVITSYGCLTILVAQQICIACMIIA
jgi:hypothetical protein